MRNIPGVVVALFVAGVFAVLGTFAFGKVSGQAGKVRSAF